MRSARPVSGLGALSEVEGNKIQSAKAALFPRQQPASFRRHLADYIDSIEQAANRLNAQAGKNDMPALHLSIVPLTGPVKGGAKPAPTRPAGAPAGAPQPSGRIRMQKGDKTLNVVPSKVEEAKRRGYTEIK